MQSKVESKNMNCYMSTGTCKLNKSCVCKKELVTANRRLKSFTKVQTTSKLKLSSSLEYYHRLL